MISRIFVVLLGLGALMSASTGQSYQLFSSYFNVGGNPDEVGRRMVKGADGNFYAVGSSGDGFVAAKYTSDGAVVWRAVYPATPYSISPTPEGGAVVVGQVDRGNLPTSREIITIRFAADGRIRWARYYPFGSDHPDASADVAIDPSGNSYVGCTVNGDSNGDLALLKYSSTGDLLWDRVLGPSPRQQSCNAVFLSPNGQILLVGNEGTSLSGTPLAYLYNSLGERLWTGSFNLVDEVSPVQAVAMDSAGALLFALAGENPSVLKLGTNGRTVWRCDLPGDRMPESVASGAGGSVFVGGSLWTSPDGFVSRIDSTGAIGWTAFTGAGASFDSVTSLRGTADGGVAAAGTRVVNRDATLFSMRVEPGGSVRWIQEHGTAAFPGPPPLPNPPLPFVPPPTSLEVDAFGNPVASGTVHGWGSPSGFDIALVKSLDSTGNRQWVTASDLNGTQDHAVASVTDLDGNTYVLSAAYQDGGTNTALTKFSPSGQVEWFKDFGGSLTDQPYALALYPGGIVVAYGAYDPVTHLYNLYVRRYTSAGNFVFKAGEFPGFKVVGMEVGSDKGIVLLGQDQSVVPNRIKVMKMDSWGGVLWSHTYPGTDPSDDFPQKLALGSANSVFVAGNVWDGGQFRATLFKYSSSGEPLWLRDHLPSGFGTLAFGLAPDSSGGVVMSGVDSANGGRGMLQRYDSSGNLLWAFLDADTDTLSERYMDIAWDRNGDLVLGGIGVRPGGNPDIMAAKFSAKGDPLWKRLYDGPAGLRDLGRWVAVDNYNSVFVAGLVSTPFQGRNYAVVKFDENGNWEWPASGDIFLGGAAVFEAGSVLSDSPAGLGLDFRGNAYVAGSAVGPSATMDPHVVKIGPTYGAQFVAQEVPTTMAAGQTYTVRLGFRNSGNIPWSRSTRIYVASRDPEDNSTWGRRRFDVPEGVVVNPGESFTFEFWVRAPSTPGTYRFTWGMRRDHAGHFGDSTTPIDIVVN